MSQETELTIVRERIVNIKKELEGFADKFSSAPESVSQEELVRSESLETELTELTPKCEALTRADRYKTLTSKKSEHFGSPVIKVKRSATRKDYDDAIRAWALTGSKKQVRDSWKRSADLVECDFTAREFFCRDQSTDVAGEGQELLNGSVLQELVSAKAFEGSMLQYCDIVPSDTAANPIHYTTNDDTGTYGRYKYQNQEVENDGLTYNKVTLTDKTATSGIKPVSYAYLLDSSAPVLQHINDTLGKRLRRTLERDVTIGAGGDYPRGIVNDVLTGATAITNTIDATAIRNLYYSVEPQDRREAKVAFAWHDDTENSLQNSLLDLTDKPQWGLGLNSGPEAGMMGKPVFTNNYLDVMGGASKKVILFGDFSAMKVRMIGPPVLVKDESTLADSFSVRFAIFQRWDAAFVNPYSVASGKSPVMALVTSDS